MQLNNITSTGTWGGQATNLNENFSKLKISAETAEADSLQAMRQATVAKEAVESLEGLADATTAMQELAALVTQINANKVDLTYCPRYVVGTKTFNNF